MRASIMALFVVFVAALLQAQDGKPQKGAGRPNPYLQRMDKNGDGQVSKDEYQGLPGTFEKLDADQDGSLTDVELRQMGRVMQQAMWDAIDREALFKALDANGDGNITLAELKAAPLGELLVAQQDGARKTLGAQAAKASLVRRYDKNGDGAISRDEFPQDRVAMFDRLDKNEDGKIDADEMAAVQNRQGGGARGGIIGRLDKNGDGRISREEFPQDRTDQFNRLDTNEDGQIDEAELRAGRGGRKPGEKRERKTERPENF
jgi:Ca2+-binding EF-hand superfamily protein